MRNGNYICDFMCRNWPTYKKHYQSLTEDQRIDTINDMQRVFGSEREGIVRDVMTKLFATSKYCPNVSDIARCIAECRSNDKVLCGDRSFKDIEQMLLNSDQEYIKMNHAHLKALQEHDFSLLREINAKMSNFLVHKKNILQ